ncbi:hypothetical protein EIN_018280 [Entamoeba invadens IP1]|uniref:hypothetical protein n=1 Tax=Entamoeba invadens IP1 TaxID=370355 RepID=UPI0002C3D06C|nr:hypothetical protein EIN_018280 [Entamoeba invadens IP1]ELP90479.1 hypothetical protein EIN_018280 [Entamoeba invadens IP1]|eukprot:XP_004257250.1 hypothetical protein EIN_018280 [Entamoeba invadens IP1]
MQQIFETTNKLLESTHIVEKELSEVDSLTLTDEPVGLRMDIESKLSKISQTLHNLEETTDRVDQLVLLLQKFKEHTVTQKLRLEAEHHNLIERNSKISFGDLTKSEVEVKQRLHLIEKWKPSPTLEIVFDSDRDDPKTFSNVIMAIGSFGIVFEGNGENCFGVFVKNNNRAQTIYDAKMNIISFKNQIPHSKVPRRWGRSEDNNEIPKLQIKKDGNMMYCGGWDDYLSVGQIGTNTSSCFLGSVFECPSSRYFVGTTDNKFVIERVVVVEIK